MFTVKSKALKILGMTLAAAVVLSVLSVIPASALTTTTINGLGVEYPEHLTVTDNGANGLNVTYNRDTEFWRSLQFTDVLIASRGIKIDVTDVDLQSNSNYYVQLNFGTTPNNQATDKGGFSVVYDAGGIFSVFGNCGMYSPAETDTKAFSKSVEPLTSQGFSLEIRLTNSKYTIKLITPSNEYTDVFDPSDALQNSTFYFAHTLWMGASLVERDFANTPAGCGFDIAIDNSQGITDSVPNGYDYIGPCWAWKTTASGTQFNIAASNNGSAGQRIRTMYSNDSLGTVYANNSSGANIKLRDITAGTTKNYSIAICLEYPNAATNWGYSYYGNASALMLLYDADGDFAICDVSAGIDNWVALYSARLDSCDETLLRDLDLNIKFTDGSYTITVGSGSYTFNSDTYLLTQGFFGVEMGVMGGFSIDQDNKITMPNGGNWNYYGSLFGLDTNDIISFTAKGISWNTPESLNIPKAEKYLEVGEMSDLNAGFTPANSSIPEIVYTSSNPEVATVDANGTVTAVNAGTATVTAASQNDSDLSDSCTVTVLNSSAGVPDVFIETVKPATVFYQDNADVVRLVFMDENVNGNIVQRQGSYRTILKKNFNFSAEPVALNLKDIVSISPDYSIAVSIGQSSNQYFDTPGYNLIVDYDGDYAVWSGNAVFNDRNILTYGKLSDSLTDSLSIGLSIENNNLLFAVNGTNFSLANTENLDLASGLSIALGTLGDFTTDSVNGVFNRDASWQLKGGKVAFVIDKAEITVQNENVIKIVRENAKNEVILAGKTATAFDPNAILTRGEAIVAMARIIASFDAINGAYTSDYTDITDDDPNYYYYSFMEKCGYLPDYGTELNPNAAITRAELADLLYNDDVNTDSVAFSDIELTDAMYNKACQAINNQAMYLDDSNAFNPNGYIARGAAAKAFCVLAGKDISSQPENTFADLLFGNVNGDGSVDIKDLVALKKAVVNSTFKLTADLDGNKTISASDLVAARQILLGSNVNFETPEYITYSVLAATAYDSQKNKITVSNSAQLLSAVSEAQSGDAGDVIIELENGNYNLTSPITISDNTNMISIAAAAGASPVITGNTDIPASHFSKVAGKEYYSYTIPGTVHPEFRNLYLNGTLLTLAKSDNYIFEQNISQNNFYVNNTVSEAVGSASSMEICLNIEWMEKHYRVDTVSSGDVYDTISIKDEEWYAYTYYDGNKYNFTGREYHFENHLGFLDEPGEFYYDGNTGTIYFYPFSDTNISESVVSYPVTEKLLELNNSSNIVLSGLNFTGVTSNFTTHHGFNGGQGGSHDWLDSQEDKRGENAFFYGVENSLDGWNSFQIPAAAIVSCNSVDLTVNDCSFNELGSNGIYLSGANYNTVIKSNRFQSIGMSAIVIGNRNELWNRLYGQTNITVTGNYIDDIGKEYRNSVAINIGAVRNLSVSRNTVVNTPQTGIGVGIFKSAGQGINIMNAEISYNYCNNNLMTLNDGSGIYLCGANGYHNDTAIYNFIHHNYVTGSSDAKIYTGIYLDANCSNTQVYSNVIEDIVTTHQPVYNQDFVASQYTRNIIVENNFTTGKAISESTIANVTDPNADYSVRNVIVRNNTLLQTLNAAANQIVSAAGSMLN